MNSQVRDDTRVLGPNCHLLVVRNVRAAKTSLYRHFETNDELVAASLEREDTDCRGTRDRVAGQHNDDGAAKLDAKLNWIGEHVGRTDYRGCPQLNVAGDFQISIIRRARLPTRTGAECASG